MASTSTKQHTQSRTERVKPRRAIPQARYRWVLLRCYTYLRKYARQVIGAYGFSLVIIIMTLFIPQLIRQTVDVGMGQRNRDVLWLSVLGMLGLTLIKGI